MRQDLDVLQLLVNNFLGEIFIAHHSKAQSQNHR